MPRKIFLSIFVLGLIAYYFEGIYWNFEIWGYPILLIPILLGSYYIYKNHSTSQSRNIFPKGISKYLDREGVKKLAEMGRNKQK